MDPPFEIRHGWRHIIPDFLNLTILDFSQNIFFMVCKFFQKLRKKLHERISKKVYIFIAVSENVHFFFILLKF
jgi:hypothetical protein